MVANFVAGNALVVGYARRDYSVDFLSAVSVTNFRRRRKMRFLFSDAKIEIPARASNKIFTMITCMKMSVQQSRSV